MSVLGASHVRSIAIFRALNLGDLLCSVPALRALRAHYPDAHITLIGLPAMADLARRFPKYIDEFVSFPGAPGLPEQPFDLDAFLAFLAREAEAKYDLVIQMHGKGSITNPIAAMIATQRFAGYFEPGEYCPDPELFLQYPEGLPEVERHLELMSFLGIPNQGKHLEFPIARGDWDDASDVRRAFGLNARPYVCIHPGARDPRRWWSASKFARVADGLARRGLSIVFTGTAAEAAIVEEARNSMHSPSVNLAGKTGLGALAALVANAELLVSNDTGVSHIAAATATPSIVIFLASDPVRWAPLDEALHVPVLPGESTDAELVLQRAESALGNDARMAAQ